MSILKILKFPNSGLNIKASPVKNISKNIITLINNLIETMFYYNALGIAATQVASNDRIIIINISTNNFIQPLVLINPTILNKSNKIVSKEGCLSFPHFFIKIKRNKNIYFKFLNLNNNYVFIKSNLLFAICLQHEIDHINGITIYDKVSNIKKKIILRKFV